MIVKMPVVKKVTLLLTDAMDKVFLKTELPSTTPNMTKQPLWLEFQVVQDGGLEYLKQNFGLSESDIDIQNCRHFKK